jgi:hypothetical protein
MERFALVDRSWPSVREQTLNARRPSEAADEMAWKLRRKGHAVDARQVGHDVVARRSWERPSATITCSALSSLAPSGLVVSLRRLAPEGHVRPFLTVG